MRPIKGSADIKTYRTLDREGRLVSVARNLHRIAKSGTSVNESWDGSIDRMMFKKDTEAQRSPRDVFRGPALKRKILVTEIARVRECISEIETFADEGVSGAPAELQRLRAKLSRLESSIRK